MKALANDTRFTIIDETEDHIVVNKPAPLKIHPSTPDGVPTLWDGLRQTLAYELANGGQISIINRLDRETSGLVLIAKNARAARHFGLAMQRRQIHKTYLALVHGHPTWDQLTLDAPILRKGEITANPIWVQQMVHPQGNPSRTHLTCLHRHPPRSLTGHSPDHLFSLIQAEPHTGRMHQIRVHLSHLGHPIVGDKIYGPDPTCYLDFIATGWTPDLAQRLLSPRQLLHSWKLRIDSPTHPQEWTAPPPTDWMP